MINQVVKKMCSDKRNNLPKAGSNRCVQWRITHSIKTWSGFHNDVRLFQKKLEKPGGRIYFLTKKGGGEDFLSKKGWEDFFDQKSGRRLYWAKSGRRLFWLKKRAKTFFLTKKGRWHFWLKKGAKNCIVTTKFDHGHWKFVKSLKKFLRLWKKVQENYPIFNRFGDSITWRGPVWSCVVYKPFSFEISLRTYLRSN